MGNYVRRTRIKREKKTDGNAHPHIPPAITLYFKDKASREFQDKIPC